MVLFAFTCYSLFKELSMARFVSALQEEIRRLARKEVKVLTAVMRRASAKHRRTIAALKRQTRFLVGKVAVLETQERKRASTIPTPETTDGQVRFSPGWIKSRRERLKLSAEAYGRLIGVAGLTIYQWEHGKSRPRKAALAKLVSIKDLGRREALHRLELLSGTKKAKPAKRKIARRKVMRKTKRKSRK
jgi:DNA-binding transcriptional regulator YiaG